MLTLDKIKIIVPLRQSSINKKKYIFIIFNNQRKQQMEPYQADKIELQQKTNLAPTQKTIGIFKFYFNQKRNTMTFPKLGHWNEKQTIKYGIFVDYHRQKLTKKKKRRLWRIFRAMSQFIKTRNPNQCRSYHEKMMKYHNSAEKIAQFFEKKYHFYEQVRNHYQSQIRQVEFNLSNIIQKNDPKEIFESKNISLNQNPEQQFYSLSYEANIQQVQQNKNKNQELPPTDAQYYPEEPKQVPTKSKLKQKLALLTQQNQIIQRAPDLQEQPNLQPNSIIQSNLYNQMPGIVYEQRDRQRNEWIQCHYSFMQWVIKLQYLSSFYQMPYFLTNSYL